MNFERGIVTARGSKFGETYHVPMNEELRGVLRSLRSRLKSLWVFPGLKGKTALNVTNYMNRVFGSAVERGGD
ncbi:MAG TPA: hypothetical protein VKD28_09990 [Gemmatimonadales bacterium]|nr:hypothetical protein [Burkholderiales bacterium]HKA58933.1 hypothetical protein [Gemmatimonadales bacterium]